MISDVVNEDLHPIWHNDHELSIRHQGVNRDFFLFLDGWLSVFLDKDFA